MYNLCVIVRKTLQTKEQSVAAFRMVRRVVRRGAGWMRAQCQAGGGRGSRGRARWWERVGLNEQEKLQCKA